MHRPLRFSEHLPLGFSRILAAALGVLLAGAGAAEEITFDELDIERNRNCCYLTEEYADLGVHFETVDDGDIWDGLPSDPGRWRIEGTEGQAFLGFNGTSYGLTVRFDEPVLGFSLDAARALGSSGAAELRLEGLVGDETVEEVVVPLGDLNEWMTASLVSEVDGVRWTLEGESSRRPYGVDHLRWEPAAAEPDPIELEIDLVAHGERHRVPLQRRGTLPVMVYGSEEVSVEELDLASLVLGDDARPQRRGRGPRPMDADGDGHMDALLFFSSRATGLELGDEWICLEGQTLDGAPVAGCMAVEVFEPHGRHRARGHEKEEKAEKRKGRGR